MTRLIGPATWYVPARQVEHYQAAGATSVLPGGRLVDARNAALDHAHGEALSCLQVSDDLRKMERVTSAGSVAPATILDVIGRLLDALAQSGAKLAGVAPTANRFYAPKAPVIKMRHFCVGDCLLVGPSDLRFDPVFSLKEDYDFTCQHLAHYGVVARCDDLLLTFLHGTNPGGAVSVRSGSSEDIAIARLMEKWPGAIFLHPRRQHEVVLRWPTPATRKTEAGAA